MPWVTLDDWRGFSEGVIRTCTSPPQRITRDQYKRPYYGTYQSITPKGRRTLVSLQISLQSKEILVFFQNED